MQIPLLFDLNASRLNSCTAASVTFVCFDHIFWENVLVTQKQCAIQFCSSLTGKLNIMHLPRRCCCTKWEDTYAVISHLKRTTALAERLIAAMMRTSLVTLMEKLSGSSITSSDVRSFLCLASILRHPKEPIIPEFDRSLRLIKHCLPPHSAW